MKKYIVLFALVVSLSTFAQDFKIGLTLAPTINFNKKFVKNENGDWITVDKSGGLGWKGGLLADYSFADNYYIHSGFLIHSKSFDTDNSNQSLTTLEIPIALKLRSNEVTENVHITGFFGSTVDLNVNAKSKVNGVEITNTKEFNPVSFSFMVGAGAEYDMDFGSIGLGLSYHLGFTDVAKSDAVKSIPKHLSIDLVFYF